jgi:hypothetical protein
MERTWKINLDGFNLCITRAEGLVRITCERDMPQVALKTTAALTLKQSKQLEAALRAANRDDAEEGSKP